MIEANSTLLSAGLAPVVPYEDWTGSQVTIQGLLIAFATVAWYNSAEVIFLTLKTFKRYSGLYFWSMLIAAVSIIPFVFGAWARDARVVNNDELTTTLGIIGWMGMVTGQSLVLYSRLHLIHENPLFLKFILWMIIVDAILLYPPTAVLTYGAETITSYPYTGGYWIVAKIQLSVFTFQEVVISGVYLRDVYKLLSIVSEGWKRSLMWQLLAINLIIILLDVVLLIVQFLDLNGIETTLKGLVYSIKLKLEFEILNKLVAVVVKRKGMGAFTSTMDLEHYVEFVSRPRNRSDGVDNMIENARSAVNLKPAVDPDFSRFSIPELQFSREALFSQSSMDKVWLGKPG